jgi:hypothetical protein
VPEAPAAAPAAPAITETGVSARLLALISERTGYPTNVTPFTGPGFVDLFDTERILTCFDRSERRPRR